MARGIRVPFIADVRDFLTGVGRAERALDDTADALDDVARDSERAAERMERSFKDMARDASQSFAKVEREGSQAMRQVSDEANETGREILSSFDGSAEGIIEGFQEVAAQAGLRLGAVGTVLGGAIAAGIGLALSEWTKFRDQVKAETEALGSAVRENLGEAFTDVFWTRRVEEFWDTNTDQAAELVRLSRLAGVSMEDVLRARVGDVDAATRLNRQLSQVVASGTTTVQQGQRFRTELSDAAEAAAAIRSKTETGGLVGSKTVADAKAFADYMTVAGTQAAKVNANLAAARASGNLGMAGTIYYSGPARVPR